MSAIAGHVSWRRSDPASNECEPILRALAPYGVGKGSIKSWNSASFGALLHPLVPEDDFDRQPLLANDCLMVADVRLDNRDDLSKVLGIDPANAAARSDSDLLFEAWLRWGEGSLDRLVGDFAFAVYSARDNRITLVRDPVGERPLFFARDNDQLVFASMPAALLAVPKFRKGLNLRNLARAAGDVLGDDETTYLKGIYRVMPGQVLTFSANDARSRIYWQPSLEPIRYKTDLEYVEAFREMLATSVQSRLRRREAPVATQLSSGFDSSAVSATAARLVTPVADLTAYTAAPRDGFDAPAMRHRFADESALAAMTCRMNGLHHVVIRPSGTAFSAMREMIRSNQEPTYNFMNLGWIADLGAIVSESGARVNLSGEYGNLTLHAGGLRVLGDFFRESGSLTWAREAWSAAHTPNVNWRGVLINSFDSYLPRAVTTLLYRRVSGRRARNSSVFLKAGWTAELTGEMENAATPPRYPTFREARLQLLRKADIGICRKGSLAMFGTDDRAPLGDRRLIEFALRLPSDQLFRGGRSRPLARRALADRLPAQVLDASMRGYQGADWFERYDLVEINGIIDEIESAGSVGELIDIPKLRETVANWPTAGFESYDLYQRLAVDLPHALATGLFIIEAEKWLSGRFD